VLALLLGEADAARYARAIAADARRLMSAFSVLEAGIVIVARKGESGGRELDLLLHRAGIEVVALSPEQAEIGRSAWLAFGRGRHPAGLNVGDCCAYALARYSGEPLLFKGDDFARTDVPAVRLV
jgi:ribonuclease VapC